VVAAIEGGGEPRGAVPVRFEPISAQASKIQSMALPLCLYVAQKQELACNSKEHKAKLYAVLVTMVVNTFTRTL
jgi:hypothetical protein